MDIKKLYTGDFSTLNFTASAYNKANAIEQLFIDINIDRGNLLVLVTFSVDKDNVVDLKNLEHLIGNIDKYDEDEDVSGLNWLFCVKKTKILEKDNKYYILYLIRTNENELDDIKGNLNNIMQFISNKKLKVDLGYLLGTFNSAIAYGNITSFYPSYLLTLSNKNQVFFKFYEQTNDVKTEFLGVNFDKDDFSDGSIMKSVDRKINIFYLKTK